MKRALPLCLFALVSMLTYGQDSTNKNILLLGRVVSDSQSLDRTGFADLPLPPIINSKYPIEIRLRINAAFSQQKMVVLTFDSQWHATYIFRNDKKDSLRRKQVLGKNLDSIFAVLVAHDVFALPDILSINNRQYFYEKKQKKAGFHGQGVNDGVAYSIEFKALNMYRRYAYNNPQKWHELMPRIHEYGDYEVITKLLEGLIPKVVIETTPTPAKGATPADKTKKNKKK